MAPAPTLYGTGHDRREASGGALRPLIAGARWLDFVNAADHDDAAGYDEFAPGYVNLVAWFQFAAMVDDAEATQLLRKAHKEPREGAAVRRRAIELREALYAIATAMSETSAPDPAALDAFNRELRTALGNGGLAPVESGLAWRWRDDIALDRPLWVICREAAEALTSDRIGRIRQCAAPECQYVFLDASKNGSRRYCSAAGCGTVERVRRFRRRQRDEGIGQS